MCTCSKRYQYPAHIRVIGNSKGGGSQKSIGKFLTESMKVDWNVQRSAKVHQPSIEQRASKLQYFYSITVFWFKNHQPKIEII